MIIGASGTRVGVPARRAPHVFESDTQWIAPAAASPYRYLQIVPKDSCVRGLYRKTTSPANQMSGCPKRLSGDSLPVLHYKYQPSCLASHCQSNQVGHYRAANLLTARIAVQLAHQLGSLGGAA